MISKVVGVAESGIESMRRSREVEVSSQDLAVSAACVWAVFVESLSGQAGRIPSGLPGWLWDARSLIEERLSVLDKSSLDFSDSVALLSEALRLVIAKRYGREGLALYSVIARRNNRELTSHLQHLLDLGAELLEIPEEYYGYVALGVTNAKAREAAKIILEKCSYS